MDESMEAITARAEALVASHRELLHDLVALRKANGLSQGDVAERMGVTQAAVSQFERYDTNPKLSTVRRYALAVGAKITHRVENDYLSVRGPSLSVSVSPVEGRVSVDWGASRLEMARA